MNVQPKRNSLVPEAVTTGPLTGSRKVYATPTGWDDVHVPLREILLSDPAEPELYVYDASGPYTEVDARIDLAKGLPRVREPWIARRGFNPYQGRPIKAEANGDAAGDKLVPACPANTNPLSGEARNCSNVGLDFSFRTSSPISMPGCDATCRTSTGAFATRSPAHTMVAQKARYISSA